MKMILISILFLVLLTGCFNKKLPPEIIYREVEVKTEVFKIPKFDIPKRPQLPIDNLNESDKTDHNAIGNAYVNTVLILKTYVKQLHNLLEGIKKGDEQ
jgi:hypothetical protein